MKDIVIKEKDVIRELYIILACFVLACCVNVGAIIAYDRPWSELWSQIGYVAFIAAGIYGLLAVVRVLVYVVSLLIKKQ